MKTPTSPMPPKPTDRQSDPYRPNPYKPSDTRPSELEQNEAENIKNLEDNFDAPSTEYPEGHPSYGNQEQSSPSGNPEIQYSNTPTSQGSDSSQDEDIPQDDYPESENDGRAKSLYKKTVPSLAKNTKKYKKYVVMASFSTLALVAAIVIVLMLMNALKIPNYATNIATYRLARSASEYARTAAELDSERLAVATADNELWLKLESKYGRLRATTWGKLDKYRPKVLYKQMNSTGALRYEDAMVKTGTFSRLKITSVFIDGKPVNLTKKSWNPWQNYKQKLKFAGEVRANVDKSLRGSNSLVRSSVTKRILESKGITLHFWEKKGAAYRNAKAAEASELQLRQFLDDVRTTPPDNIASADLKDALKDMGEAGDKCLETPKCLEQAIAGKFPDDLADALSRGIKKSLARRAIETVGAVINPALDFAIIGCLIYDGSMVNSGGDIDAQSDGAVKSFYATASAADQQKTGDTTAEAVGAFQEKLGDDESVPDQYLRGEQPDTSIELSPQASVLGSYTLADLIPNARVADVVKNIAGTCEKLTSTEGIIISTVVALIVRIVIDIVTAGGAEGFTVTAQTTARATLTNVLKKFALKKLLGKIISWTAWKEGAKSLKGFALKFGAQFVGIELATIAAKLIVLHKAGLINDGAISTGSDFVNKVDMGAEIHNNETARQMFFGAPMTNKEVAYNDSETLAYLNNKEKGKSINERYFALSNPKSLLSRTTYQLAYIFNIKNGEFNKKIIKTATFLFNTGNIFNHNKLLAAGDVANSHYGVVQWGYTEEEYSLINKADGSYGVLENSRILEESGKKDEIEAEYGECFTRSMGDLLSKGDIERDESGDVYVNKGKCSPNNLGPHNSKYGNNVFRWRLEKRREQVLDHNTGIQEPTATETNTNGLPTDNQNDQNTEDNNNLYVLGGSITCGLRDNTNIVQKYSNDDWNPTVSCRPGRTLEEGLRVAKEQSNKVEQANMIVVALGNNNSEDSDSIFMRKLDDLYKYLKSQNKKDAPIYWLNYVAYENPKAENNGLVRVRLLKHRSEMLDNYARQKGIHVLDWATESTAADYENGDGLHPNKKVGYHHLSRFILKKTVGIE